MNTFDVTVQENTLIADGIYRMVMRFPDGVEFEPRPGQFINIAVPDSSHILRRPISICDADREGKTLTIIYQIKGEGTQKLSMVQPGEQLDVLAALGNGFPTGDAGRVLLVGGGIGIAPLYYCGKELGNADAILGYRSSRLCYYTDEFKGICNSVTVVTEDGSTGLKGFVTAPMEERLRQDKPDSIFACGPIPMLRAVAALAEKYNVKCYLSLEERMGCGMGACLVCNCKVKSADGFDYKRVCADGPVFSSEEVLF